jgi:hypothetical protein
MENIKQETKKEIDHLLEENVQETKNLQQHFDETKRLLLDKIDLFQQKILDWETKYAKRESRSEDLVFIEQLKQELIEKDQLVKKTMEEYAYFKRELLNREETYNKTFARAPNVGVMNVLKTQASTNGGGIHNASSSMNTMNSMNMGVSSSSLMNKRKTKPSGMDFPPELTRRNSTGINLNGGTTTSTTTTSNTPISSSLSTQSSAKKSLPPLNTTSNQLTM